MKNDQNLGNDVTGADLAPLFPDEPGTAMYFARQAEWITFPARTSVMRQFHQADFVYLLVDGEISCSVQVDDAAAPIHVGRTARPWTAIGWSGLRPPGRFSMTVETECPSRFLRWPTPDLWRLLYADPRRATRFLECVVDSGLSLLEAMRREIRAYGQDTTAEWEFAHASDVADTGRRVGSAFDGAASDAAEILGLSPFFREFTDDERAFFAGAAQFLRVRGGERVLVQGGVPDGVYVLVRGRVSLKFRPPDSSDVVTRSIGRDGTVFNWCGIDRPLATPYTVVTTRDTILLHIPGAAIAERAARNPEFGFVYSQRVLWLLGQFFLAARMRLISERAENEILAVASLIDQKATEIPLRSELYKIPHLLGHPNTRQDGFNTLYRLVTFGTPLERGLAGLSLDIMTDVERETRFRDKLAYIYERVAGADPSATRAALLHESSKGLLHAFEEVPYVIAGMDNLPAESSFLAIYNHLACNKQYQLPNNFEFTLDSHFVSSIVLRRFGTPGLRIVKASDSAEFWHRGYYGRILTIQVSADESRVERARFYQTVENTLAARTPVVIAPEGTNDTGNSWTETSPGPFRPGAFVLAMRMKHEPWIVPIALANFDKSVKNSVFAAVVKPPFRMSEHVSDANDRAAVSRFLDDYRRVFRGYVEEARDLAEDVRRGVSLRPGLISNYGRLNRLDKEFAADLHELERRVCDAETAPQPVVFYGSSSFRLWAGLADDLGVSNVLNLGFGGSTLEACAHFFERLVVPHQPSALFVYAGDNDIGNGEPADQVVEHCRAFLYKVDQFMPDVPVHLVSIKPSPFRAHQLDDIVRANRGMAALAAARPDTRFIDIFPAMLRGDGTADPSLFNEDMLHMNTAGYARWSAALRPPVQALQAVA